MTNTTPRLARRIPRADDFAKIDWMKVDTSRNQQRGPRAKRRRRFTI